MAFSPTITQESSVRDKDGNPLFPGVKYTFRRMGFAKRTELELQSLNERQRLRELEQDFPPLSEKEREISDQLEVARKKFLAVDEDQADAVFEKDVKPLAIQLRESATPEAKKKRAAVNEEYGLVLKQINARAIRAALVAIEGGECDGMTPDELLDFGPPELAEEIARAINSESSLRGAAAINFPSPGASTAPAEQEKTSTTAPAANSAESSSTETASVISPSA